jgi:hypothetical protein
MADEIAEFVWTVPSNGFKWQFRLPTHQVVEDPPTPIPVLTDDVELSSPIHAITYRPLEEYTGLFRTFAEVQPSEDGVIHFANKYGALGGIYRQAIALKEEDGKWAGLGSGETLTAWKHEIAEIRRMLTYWDAARARDTQTLRGVIHWDDSRVRFQDSDAADEIASARYRPDVLKAFRAGDVIAPAFWYLQSCVNRKLTEHKVVARLLWDPRLTALSVRVVPSSLIGCIWLQLAKAIEGNREYRQCENCKLWFEIGGSRTARSDKRFCSPTCKAAANRKKRQATK